MPNNTIGVNKSGIAKVFNSPLPFLGAQALMSGSSVTANCNACSPTIGIQYTPGRGGSTNSSFHRLYFYFDVSSYTTTITNPILSVHGFSSVSLTNLAVVKAQQNGSSLEAFGGGSRNIAVEDFSRYSSASADFYYNGPPGWSTSGWNDLSLNASASVAISESNSFIVCLIEARYDIEKRTPGLGDTLTAASYGSGSATLYPRLHFTSSAAGWDGGMILGVSASSISSIIGVDRTNISSINGVT